jgi:excinuclease ABC subunit C
MAPPKVEEKLALLPEACGVYLFKDAHNKVIYVGKAVNLRSRVRSYFQASGDERVFVEHMVPKVAGLDWVIVANEKEALILENNLIKQFKPRFNINLKDDKTFLSIKLDRREPFPRLELVRRYTPEEGVRYFGPFSSAAAARETLRIVNAIFPIRKSPDAVFRNRTRPCIYYELGRCVAPCVGYVDAAGYGELLDEVEMFLRGRNQELAEAIRAKMAEAAGRQEYELAAKFRDQLQAVERTMEKQTITTPQSVDRDVFGYFKAGDEMQVQALLVRRGRLQDVPSYGFDTKGLSAEAAFAAFLKQFYARTRFIPSEILVPVMPPDADALAEWLTDLRSGEGIPRREGGEGTAGQASRGTDEEIPSRGIETRGREEGGEGTAGPASRGTGEDTAGEAQELTSRGVETRGRKEGGEDTAGQASRGTDEEIPSRGIETRGR